MSNLYFAYGSNMDAEQMADRCPGAECAGVGTLPDYRFIINQRGYATLRSEEYAETPGVLWRLDAAHERALDRYEGYRVGLYDKCWRELRTESGDEIKALVYIDHRNQRLGTPRDGYIKRIIAGAEAYGLPEGHVGVLRAWPHKRDLKGFNQLISDIKAGNHASRGVRQHKEESAQALKEEREELPPTGYS